MKKTNLISENILRSANNRYNELLDQAKSEGKTMGGEIELFMSLTSRDIETLMNAKDDDIELKAIENQLDIYLGETGKSKNRDIFGSVLGKWNGGFMEEITQIKKMTVFPEGEVLIRYNTPPGTFRDQASVSPSERHYLKAAHTIGLNANNLVKMIRNLRCVSALRFTEDSFKEDVK